MLMYSLEQEESDNNSITDQMALQLIQPHR